MRYTEYALQLIDVDREISRLQKKQAKITHILNAQLYAYDVLCNKIKTAIKEVFRYVNSYHIKLNIDTYNNIFKITALITSDKTKMPSDNDIRKNIFIHDLEFRLVISEKDMQTFDVTKSELEGNLERIKKELQKLFYVDYKKETAN